MKRSSFLKQLIALPFGPYLAQKFFLDKPRGLYLLNKFYVAGFQYYDGPSIIKDIQIREKLKLVTEPNNEYDKFAVAIYRNGTMVGHVPRTDNNHISLLLQQGAKLVCKVQGVYSEEESWKMVKVNVYI